MFLIKLIIHLNNKQLSQSVWSSVHLSFCLSVSYLVYMYIAACCLYMFLSIYLNISLSFFLSEVSLSVCYLFVAFQLYIFVCLSQCLFVCCLSVCLIDSLFQCPSLFFHLVMFLSADPPACQPTLQSAGQPTLPANQPALAVCHLSLSPPPVFLVACTSFIFYLSTVWMSQTMNKL
jgi:hypothetical protein